MMGQKEQAPFSHYRKIFSDMKADEITKRTGIAPKNGIFSVEILGKQYPVSHPDYHPVSVTSLDTLLLRYLTEVGAGEPTQQFLSFGEMPWGDVYLPAFRGRILSRAAFTLATQIPKFCDAAERMGAQKCAMGDVAYEFEFLKNYRLRWILWRGDEEFAPNAQLLFSANFVHFTAEDRVVIAELSIKLIKEAFL